MWFLRYASGHRQTDTLIAILRDSPGEAINNPETAVCHKYVANTKYRPYVKLRP